MINILIALFGIALVGLLSLVVLKTHALQNGGDTFITRLFPEERDRRIEQNFKKKAKHVYKRAKIISVAFLHIFLEVVVHWLSKLLDFLRSKTEDMRDSVMGKGVLKKNGSASFFLKDIVEHKRNHMKKGGRIDD